MTKLKLFTASTILFCLLPITTALHAETDAELMASGQWHDPKTGLIWMRCLVGQKWTGTTCAGEAKNVSPYDSFKMMSLFNQAGGFAGQNNWRLPTVAELSALRQCNTWDYREDKREELTFDGSKIVTTRTPTFINIPSGKGTGTIAISPACRDMIESMDEKDPQNWRINTKIFRGLLVHDFMDLSFPASSQPTQTQITPNTPLWKVKFTQSSDVTKEVTYATSSLQSLFAVRSRK